MRPTRYCQAIGRALDRFEDAKGRLSPSAAAHLRSALESIDRWESVARAAVFWSTRRRKHLDYDVALLAPLPE